MGIPTGASVSLHHCGDMLKHQHLHCPVHLRGDLTGHGPVTMVPPEGLVTPRHGLLWWAEILRM